MTDSIGAKATEEGSSAAGEGEGGGEEGERRGKVEADEGWWMTKRKRERMDNGVKKESGDVFIAYGLWNIDKKKEIR